MYEAAIIQLDISAGNCENNAPIYEAEGNQAQAELARSNAESYRAAIEQLKKHI